MHSAVVTTLLILVLFAAASPTRAQVAIRVPDEEWDVYGLAQGPRGLWVTQSGSLYLIENGEVKEFGKAVPYINSLSNLNGNIWLATREGAFRMDGDTPTRMSDERVVRRVELVGQEIWFATDKGAYPLATPLKRTPDQQLDVRAIEQIDNQIWLATKTGAFRTDRTNLYPIAPELHLDVYTIKSINGKIWLGTETGLYTVNGNNLTLVSDEVRRIYNIAQIDGRIWLCSLQGVYSFDETNGLKPLLNDNLDVKEMRKIASKFWVATGSHPNQHGGIYRVDEDVSISIRPSRSWLEALLQDVFRLNVWIEGTIKPEIQYSRRSDNTDPYGSEVPKEFDVILTFSKTDFDEAIRKERYSRAPEFERTLSGGRTTIYLSARDKWGNRSAPVTITAWVIPKPFLLFPLLLALLWWALLLLVLFLAPYSKFFMRALMNPFLRKVLTFGFVPLIITLFPVARRHLLKAYLREVARDDEFAEWQKRFVLPDEQLSAPHIAEMLGKNSVLFLVGESGIGKTSYFKYLLGCYASDRKLLSHVVPVFLPLRRHRGKAPIDIFASQLATYGGLTDVELTKWLLGQGEFLIFIDGLNEVNELAVEGIVAFVEELHKVNYFFLSSQETYVDFERAKTVSVPTLDAAHIKKVLEFRLGDRAQAIIDQFTEGMFKEYGVPQELELAIDLVEDGKPLPQGKLELYEATLNPIFDSWHQAGREYETELCRRAYEMLSKGESSFESKDSTLSLEIRNRLVENKLLYLRGGQYQFRHDLIRAYLAAKYLAPRWNELLDGEKPVRLDANWNSTIKFVTLVYDNTDDRKKLLFSVLQKNSQVAKDVFNWLEKEHPTLVADWSSEFDRNYGRTMRTVVSVGKSTAPLK
jgi:hypothetical protein